MAGVQEHVPDGLKSKIVIGSRKINREPMMDTICLTTGRTMKKTRYLLE
jgi:hypothetical protein